MTDAEHIKALSAIAVRRAAMGWWVLKGSKF